MARSITLALIAALAISSIATATSVQKFSVRDLATKSSSIAVARVTASESRWDGGEIYTYITLQVSEGVKGARKGETLQLRQLGGQIGDIASIVPGMPSFKSNEEVLVFLTAPDKGGYRWVMGLEQGKYSISTDSKGKKNVRRDTAALNLIDRGGDTSGAMPEDSSLDLLLDEVRTEAGVPLTIAPSEGVQ
jgi:hypothetical protein